MTPQIAAGSIAEAQFLNQVRILQTSILQILNRFGIAVELHLEKGSGSGEQRGLSGQSEVLFQTGEAFAEGEVLGKLHKADQVTAALTAVTIEQILAGIDIERRPGIRVQRAESHELLSRGDAATGPVAPLQVLQQRNTLFELFQVLAHGLFSFLERAYERTGRIPRQGWWVTENLFRSAEARSGEGAGKQWARTVARRRDGEPVRPGSLDRTPGLCIARTRRAAERNPGPETSGGGWKNPPRDGDLSPAVPPPPRNSLRQSSAVAPHCERSGCNGCREEKPLAGR